MKPFERKRSAAGFRRVIRSVEVIGGTLGRDKPQDRIYLRNLRKTSQDQSWVQAGWQGLPNDPNEASVIVSSHS